MDLASTYLSLMKRSLIRSDTGDPDARTNIYDPALRDEGRDWPRNAHSMIGRKRMDNIEDCVRQVVADRVPGDLVETGVWRGGASIFMRACLLALADQERDVWVCDSFAGLPVVDADRYPADRGHDFASIPFLAVSEETVRTNFAHYGLLDERVHFLKGWFKDTLPTAPIKRIAVLRLDGDLYESTMDALKALYPKISPNGYCIIDDYGDMPPCRAAVDDFRAANRIGADIHFIDWTGVYWRRRPGEGL